MNEELYIKLREHLHNLPGGFPPTKEGHEIRILKKLFTPEEAEYAMALRPVPEDIAAIAKRLSMSETEASEKIENLARKGLIFRIHEGNDLKYMAISWVVGIYEFQLGKIDREMAELYEKYKLHYGMQWLSTKTKQMRTIPIDVALPMNTSIETYDRVRDFVKSQKLIGLADCICRKKNELLDKKCGRPHETCLSFGDVAQYYIDYKMARPISQDDALKVLELAEQSALVICPTNTVEHSGICLCCSCCCGTLSGMRLLPNPAEYMHSTYQAKIDSSLCSSCGICLERCQINAIKEEDSTFTVNPKRCIGCGLCVSTCPVEAVALYKKEGEERPQGNFWELLAKISKERGISSV